MHEMQVNVSPLFATPTQKRQIHHEMESPSPSKIFALDLDSTVESPVQSQHAHDSTFDPEGLESSVDEIQDEDLLEDFCDSNLVLCEAQKIESLLKRCQDRECQVNDCTVEKCSKGALITFTGICHKGHKSTWRSSSYINQKPLINTEIAAACLCSGIPYAAMARFAKSTKMAFMSEKTFYNHTTNYCYPVIKEKYFSMRENIKSEIGKVAELVFAGDGRYDSPGKNSAKYCHYSLLDVATNLVFDFVLWQKGIEPGDMESKAFKFLFDRVLTEVGREKVKIFCSDRSLTVGRIMKDVFSTVHHAFDVRWLKLIAVFQNAKLIYAIYYRYGTLPKG